jgi:hypothetical protein
MFNTNNNGTTQPSQDSLVPVLPAMSAQTSEAPMVLSLTDLSREILDRIYHELWASTDPVTFSCDIKGWPVEAKFTTRYQDKLIWRGTPNPPEPARLLPDWLLTCKEMLYGGMTQLLLRSDCNTCLLEDSPTTTADCTSLFGSVVTNAVKRLVLEIETSFWSEDSYIRKPTPACHSLLTQVVPVLSRDFRNLSVVCLAFGFEMTGDNEDVSKKWRRLDLSVLEAVNLPKLHTLQVHFVTVPEFASKFNSTSRSVQRVCQQDVSMLGMKLIGRQGKTFMLQVGTRRGAIGDPLSTSVFMWTNNKAIISSWKAVMALGNSLEAKFRQDKVARYIDVREMF